jgi:hypothetical protein
VSDDALLNLAAMPGTDPNPGSLYKLPEGYGHQLWGASVPLAHSTSTLASASWTTVVYTDSYDEAVDWHVELSLSTNFPITNGVVVAQINYSLGPTQFIKYVVLSGPGMSGVSPRHIHIQGRYVQVSVAWISYFSGTVNNITVNGGAHVGGIADSSVDKYGAQWVLNSGTGTKVVTQGPGKLMAWQATMTSMTGDSQAYLQFFDGIPGSGGVVIWSSPPFTAAGQWYSFSDESGPTLCFSTQDNSGGTLGLQWALSSTAATYSASTGSGNMTVWTKVGS